MSRAMMDEFSLCMVFNTRKAARAVTRRYDAYLRPYGMTATQFSLLGGVASMPGATVSQIAEERGFERTTLTRNLDKLQAMGLIESRPTGRDNGRRPRLTPKGDGFIAELMPLWRRAQAELRADLGAQGFTEALAALQRLSKVQTREHTQ